MVLRFSATHKLGQPIAPRLLEVTGHLFAAEHVLLVGGVVTAYERLNRTTDSINEKFALYGAACLALYPAGRLLQWAETIAPLWLGGHIVGFSSFFGWTLYTESDLLKSDRELLSRAEQREQRKR